MADGSEVPFPRLGREIFFSTRPKTCFVVLGRVGPIDYIRTMAPTMTHDFADAKWEQCVIRSLPEVPSLLGSLLDVLRLLDYSEKELFGIHLSLEEVIVNAIKHGNGENPLKTVQIRYQATAQEFVIEIQDEGAGFDPSRVPDPLDPANLERPGGRGIFVAQRFMTWVKYNEAGNCVTLCKVHAAANLPGAGSDRTNPVYSILL